MGGVITEEPFLSVFPETKNANVQGIIIALLELGALIGSILCMLYADRLGRRATVWIGMGFMVVGGVLQTSAWHVAQLGVGRVLSGIGLGLQIATVPTWQSMKPAYDEFIISRCINTLQANARNQRREADG